MEFTLVLPVVILICFGAIEFGLATYQTQVLRAAADDAASYGSAAVVPRRTAAEIQAKANTFLAGAIISGTNTVVTVTGAAGDPGSFLTVDVSQDMKTSYVKLLVGDSTPLRVSSRAVATME